MYSVLQKMNIAHIVTNNLIKTYFVFYHINLSKAVLLFPISRMSTTCLAYIIIHHLVIRKLYLTGRANYGDPRYATFRILLFCLLIQVKISIQRFVPHIILGVASDHVPWISRTFVFLISSGRWWCRFYCWPVQTDYITLLRRYVCTYSLEPRQIRHVQSTLSWKSGELLAHAWTYFVRPATAAAEGSAATDTWIQALTYAETLRTSLLSHFARYGIHIVREATPRMPHYRHPVNHCSLY